MSCLLTAFHCANPRCKKIIKNPSSIGRKYCEACKKVRDYECKAYHRYMCRMMEASV
jgi:hypothetical protein